jgi:aryl-alcohol dehydrogenase-like predicted oxidoreductase
VEIENTFIFSFLRIRKDHSLALILGGNIFGYSLDKRETFKLLDQAFEYGILQIDTAGVYSSGLSESIIGEWIASRKRQESMKIITKLEIDNINSISAFEASLHFQFEASLSRLRCEQVDTLLLHHYPTNFKFLETYLNFVEKKISLKQIAHWGISNIAPKEFSFLVTKMVQRQLREVTVQNYCNWAKRDADYWSQFFSLINQEQMTLNVMSYGVFGRGALVKVPNRNPISEEFGKQRSFLNPLIHQEKSDVNLQAILQAIYGMISEKENPLESFALSFILQQRSMVIIGVRTTKQLESILDLIRSPINHESVQEILFHISTPRTKLDLSLGDSGFGI